MSPASASFGSLPAAMADTTTEPVMPTPATFCIASKTLGLRLFA